MSKKAKETEQLTIEGTSETEILTRLSERVDRAVALIGQLRRENDDLRGRAEGLEGELEAAINDRNASAARAVEAEKRAEALESDGSSRAAEMEKDVERLRDERNAIRNKVEGILEKLEGLEESASE